MTHWGTENKNKKENWFMYKAIEIEKRNSQKSVFKIQQ